jgi:hypothetical protein
MAQNIFQSSITVNANVITALLLSDSGNRLTCLLLTMYNVVCQQLLKRWCVPTEIQLLYTYTHTHRRLLTRATVVVLISVPSFRFHRSNVKHVLNTLNTR